MNRTGQNRTLSGRQQRVVAAYLETGSVSQAVRKARVSRSQFYAWMNEPDSPFREALRREQHALYSAVLLRLQGAMLMAAEETERLLHSDDERVRLAACRMTLDAGLQARDRLDLEDRIRRLEKSMPSLAADRPPEGGDMRP